ncbi:MAG: Glycerate dehydrogenase [Alphaproteobacteria bacterium MarineAlpha10_Bin2]|nr:D-glycerate dehydrogenase [Pseudomonadota bacterium]PPR23522.1 MAG: Glycerate dehydrogenase [Alphaproteobacteria bacterium MarineAlpha10_Bin2]
MPPSSKKPLVFVTRRLPDQIQARMMELFDTRLNDSDTPLSQGELIEAVQSADAFVPTVTDAINREVIAAAGDQLKLIASFGTGVDHVDLAAAKERNILVTNTPGVLTEDTADMAMALLLSAPRRLSEGDRLVRGGGWQGWAPTSMLGQRIWGKRLGIIGMGRIGQAVARRALGFGLTIHYHNRKRVHAEIEEELDATWWESLDQMLAHMDLITIHCPSTPATFHLLSARRLKLVRSTSYIVNTSRGHAIDEAALAALLEQGSIAGAGLDVYENEPAINAKLLKLDNVVLLPHMSSATVEGRLDMGEKVLINIQTWADGHMPPDRVIETAS